MDLDSLLLLRSDFNSSRAFWIFVLWLVFLLSMLGLIGLGFGNERGRGFTGFMLGFFLGPIGWILILCLEPDGRRCPECLGVVPNLARRCRHCSSELPPSLAPRRGWLV